MPTIAEVLTLAIGHHQAGRLQAAESLYRQILQADPNHDDAIHLLGLIAHQAGRHEIAVEYISRAIELDGNVAAFHNNLGEAYRVLRRIPEAVACYHRALKLKPDYAEAHNNLGIALKDQGKLDEAIACYRRALELKPDYAEAHNNLGNVFKDQGRLDDAVACYWRALKLKPDYAEAHNNLGNVFKDRGKLDEAIACYRQALALRPDYVHAHENLLNTLLYRDGVTLPQLADAQAEYDQQHAAPLRASRWQPHLNRSDPNRLLRLGFVSPDLGYHPVGYFLIRVLDNLDRRALETVCYSDRLNDDALTARLRNAAGIWRRTVGVTDEELAEQIRADRIDILFDLAGHTAGNRLMVFARKPAPIQITWLGYAGSTGLAAMDYILADHQEIPRQFEPFYREKVLRLPDGYVCYDPPAHAPPVAPLPASAKGSVTFGSFNNPAKVTPEVVATWSAILRQVPGAKLVLKYRGWEDKPTRQRYRELFSAAGVGAERVALQGWSTHAESLAQYHEIDLALDPFPYCGGLTTCEALWMGVPVITCPGETFASRHSLSHLSNVGLTETIAHDLDEYVELAVSLASDLPRLAKLRAGLRERMAASPLCDGKRFATNLLALLRKIWQQWCKQQD